MSQHSSKQGGTRKQESKSSLMLSILIVILIAVFSPELLDFDYTKDQVSDPEMTEIIQASDGSNYDVLPELKRIPVDFVRTQDGDTITVKLGDDDIRVRYLMIDTPEMNYNQAEGPEPYAEAALKRNQQLLEEAEQVYVELDIGPATDDYHRLLAYVYADDVLISEKLLQEGLGTVRFVNPPNNSYEELLRSAQEEAEAASLNLWQ